MDPINIVLSFFGKVFTYVKDGIVWRKSVNAYEEKKNKSVAKNYKFRIFPIDFISIRRSKFEYDNTVHGSAEDYAQTYIKIKDIYPFILNAHSSYLIVRSFRKFNPSKFDGLKLNIGYGYILGEDGKYHSVNANNYLMNDKPKTHGVLSFYTDPGNAAANRQFHTVIETGKAYALAPDVNPNILTQAQVVVKGKDWIYILILLLIVVAYALNSKEND